MTSKLVTCDFCSYGVWDTGLTIGNQRICSCCYHNMLNKPKNSDLSCLHTSTLNRVLLRRIAELESQYRALEARVESLEQPQPNQHIKWPAQP